MTDDCEDLQAFATLHAEATKPETIEFHCPPNPFKRRMSWAEAFEIEMSQHTQNPGGSGKERDDNPA